MHHHGGVVADVLHGFAGFIHGHALVLAQLGEILGELFQLIAGGGVIQGGGLDVQAQLLGAGLHGLRVTQDGQLAYFVFQKLVRSLEDAVIIALGQHDVCLALAGFQDEVALEELWTHLLLAAVQLCCLCEVHLVLAGGILRVQQCITGYGVTHALKTIVKNADVFNICLACTHEHQVGAGGISQASIVNGSAGSHQQAGVSLQCSVQVIGEFSGHGVYVGEQILGIIRCLQNVFPASGGASYWGEDRANGGLLCGSHREVPFRWDSAG